MEYIIGIIFLIIILFVTGFFIKKKYFKVMDRLESWKIDLTDRPVLDEMSKVKQLNMNGQTEELFERWRNEWDEIVTVRLPNLEELLFDAEEYIDKYRFRRAAEIQQTIGGKLQEIEDSITKILDELNNLVGSEEKNRVEMEHLTEVYRDSKKTLLAHRHSFGKSEKNLEKYLDEVSSKFRDFADKTEDGDYLEAREVVLTIKNKLEMIKKCMEMIPQYLIECQSILPAQFYEVNEGYREMTQQGYYLEHLQLEEEVENLERDLAEMIAYIEEANIDNIGEGINGIKDKVDELFDLMEKEVNARHFIIQHEKQTAGILDAALSEGENLKAETVHIQQSYHIAENELEMQRHLEVQLSSLYKRFEILTEKIKQNDTAQSFLSEELGEIKDELDSIQEEQRSFGIKLQALRKDELAAREKVNELIKRIGESSRILSKSNIPGLPQEYKYLFEDAKESIQHVTLRLEENPLNISSVHQYLEIAVLTVDKLLNTTTEMVENVALAEKVIQYGNRYRRNYPSIAKGLNDAEASFRKYDYRGALEQAATSIEEIDPGALKKIESILNNEE
ncbi:MAG: septation ring formation regulator EzrA [Bacillota bacterium]|nr:septation ring formation regulator EzrA [Bacillota bacterium]